MFIAALFTVAERGKQPKCPWIHVLISKIFIGNKVLFSLRKGEDSDTGYNMDNS